MASFAWQMSPTPEVFGKQRSENPRFHDGDAAPFGSGAKTRLPLRQTRPHTNDVRKTLFGRGGGVV